MPTEFKRTLEEYNVPLEMQDAFWNYFMYGWEPGSFGMAILRNDFFAAVCHAHPSLTAEHLRDIARWFYNIRLPGAAYGSDEKINAWKKLTDEERKEIMEDLRLCPTLFDILRSVPGPD
jgi:hypothetical protein